MRTPCRIHYAINNTAPAECWREMDGQAIAQGRKGGPKNILVDTDLGRVVVPRGNVRFYRATSPHASATDRLVEIKQKKQGDYLSPWART